MTSVDQGWCIDDGPDEDDTWDDDPYDEDDDYEPDWGYIAEMQEAWLQRPPIGRERRRLARAGNQDRRLWRQQQRHANDRFWQARNGPVFPEEAPF